MKKYFGYLLVCLVVIFVLLVVYKKSNTSTKTGHTKIQVAASFYPLYFFTQEIGKEKVDVRNITPAGAEPHEYELTAQDIDYIEQSNLLVLNGGGLESWGEKIKNDLSKSGVKTVITEERLVTLEKDPHIWLSPVLVKEQVRNILSGLIEVDRSNKEYYEKNYRELENKLDRLDLSYRQRLTNCSKRDFVTSHSAFGYLAKTYNLNLVPISGLSPEEEPSVKELTEIVKFAKEHDIKYIFFETLISPRLSETIAQEVGATTLVLDPIEGIELSAQNQGENYFTLMEKNLVNLRRALECQ